MKNKKGFTLVELLAVIVILAIIALIATPIVIKVIGTSEEGAAKVSASNYLKAVETSYAAYMMKNPGASYTTGKHTVSELETDLKVEVSGEVPKEGNVCIGNNGIITKASLKISKYVVSYDGKDATITDLEEVENITCEESETALDAKYFEFGTPTTSSTTDYTTLGKNVFATLYSDGITGGVCINDGDLFCLQRNDFDNSKELLKTHFGEDSCTDNGAEITCSGGGFYCGARSDGNVLSANFSTGACAASPDGTFSCS